MRRSVPPAEQIQDALHRLLASETFSRSERARDLLRYLVEQQLAGRADRLKGFAIAVDVFGKDEKFDPATDAVVRVQAGRLRELLEHYYAGEGAADALRITIARGGYVPEYELVSNPGASASLPGANLKGAGSATAAIPAAARRGWPSRRSLWLGGMVGALVALAIAGAGAFLYRTLLPQDQGVQVTSPMPPAEVEATESVFYEQLPSVSIIARGDGDAIRRTAAALRRGLAGFDTVDFIVRERPDAKESEPSWTDFVFVVLQETIDDDVLVELQHPIEGRVIMSRAIGADQLAGAVLNDTIADLLTAAVPASGSIYTYIEDIGRQTPLVRCLTLSEGYFRNQTLRSHREAYQCLEALLQRGSRSSLVHSELAGLQLRALGARYSYPAYASEATALELARRAVQLAPTSPYAHRAHGFVLQRTGQAEEATHWMRRAYELNMFDLSMAASYAYGLIFAGDYEGGTPVMQRAVRAASVHPTWWDYGLFLGHFMLSDMRSASNALAPLAASTRAHYIAVRLIAADGLGQGKLASRLVEELRMNHASFVSDPRAFFMRASYPDDMVEKLVAALRQAGLSEAS